MTKCYSEKFKKDPNKWRYILCSWFRKLNSFKISVPPNSPIRFHAIPMKISRLSRTYQADSKLYVEKPRAKTGQRNFKKYKVGGLILPDFKDLFTKRENKLYFNKSDF